MGGFIISDPEYVDSNDDYKVCANKIEDALKDYSKIINACIDHKSVSGKAANALRDFNNCLTEAVTNQLSQIVDTHARQMSSFIDDIDVADEDLY